ncbi:MAG: hypothetical protein V8S89_05860 [Oscillospiraceae bacterium]
MRSWSTACSPGGWNARQETANALLDADITFNENVLDADGNLTEQAGWRQWTPIGGYTWISGTGFGASSNTALYKAQFRRPGPYDLRPGHDDSLVGRCGSVRLCARCDGVQKCEGKRFLSERRQRRRHCWQRL